jgi:hypothetical protein
MRLKGKRIAILVANEFEDIAALSQAGLEAMADIKTKSPNAERAVTLIEEALAKFGR